jgi:hypothetical protein
MQVSVNASACDDGRIRCDDQALIVRNYYLTAARTDLRTSPSKDLGLIPVSAAAASPSRWLGSGKLPLPGRAR